MKKLLILTMALSICAAMLVGCGCVNTDTNVTTLPTNGETATPSTQMTTVPTTAPTTAPTTMPTTEAPTEASSDTTGPVEGAMDDILGGSTDDATTATGAGRSRGNGPSMR